MKTIEIKKYQFSNINEYEIISEDLETQETFVKIAYSTGERILTLVSTKRVIPKFEPYEFRYEVVESILEKEKKSETLRKVLETVRKDPKYQPEISIVVERATHR